MKVSSCASGQAGNSAPLRCSAKVPVILSGALALPWLLPVLMVMAGMLTGCHLSQPASTSFASVVIQNRTSTDIQATMVSVFTANGYQTMANAADELVFEKEGTRANEIAHGGWIDDTGVRERVRARIFRQAPGQYRLQCQAFMVRHASDPVLQDEVRLKNFRARPYQRLLDEVAGRLN